MHFYVTALDSRLEQLGFLVPFIRGGGAASARARGEVEADSTDALPPTSGIDAGRKEKMQCAETVTES